MKLFLKLLILIITITSCSLSKQFNKENQEITLAMNQYVNFLNNKEIDSLKIFMSEKIIGREGIDEEIQRIKDKFNEKDFIDFKMDPKYDIVKIIDKNNVKYSALNYTIYMTGHHDGSDIKYLNNFFGLENVTFDKDKQIVKIKMDDTFYGIKDESSKWVFIRLTEATSKFLPEEIQLIKK